MVNFCAVIGCNSTGGRDKVSFFRLPAIVRRQGDVTMKLSEKRRQRWLMNISRADLAPRNFPYTRVCSKHFKSGKPAPLYSEEEQDWAPTLLLGHEKLKPKLPNDERTNRQLARSAQKECIDVAESLISLSCSRSEDTDHVETEERETNGNAECEKLCHQECQTNLDGNNLHLLETEFNNVTSENVSLRSKISELTLSEDSFRDNNEKVKLFTGLPSFAVLMTLFSFVENEIPCSHKCALTKFQKLILVFLRLKLNLNVLYIADLFRVSPGTVSKYFLCVIHVLYVKLKHLVYWPSQEERRATMPMVFRKSFGTKVAVIIDCFELFIERPSNLKARAQTWSSYKHHNTVKFLIGISPQGVISFISKGYGGRCSDKFITNNCAILCKLDFGDVVLADRGFDIAESVAQASCELKIPAFTKGKTQLSAIDVENTRKLAHVRIHVERVIGLVRGKFKILQDTIPVDYLFTSDNSTPTIDKIVTTCCALTNVCKSVVSFE